MSRICTLREAVSTLPSGSSITFGGFALNRAPMALVRELIRQKRKRLNLFLLPNPLALDFLIGAGAVDFAEVAFAAMEVDRRTPVAPNWEAAATNGRVRWLERDAIYLVQGLRAAALGVPFLPLPMAAGPAPQPDVGSVRDPFRRCLVPVVRAIEPEVALIHAQAADREGNLWIEDPVTDELVVRASRRVIATTERIVKHLRRANIPSMLVSSVVHSPAGAWPTACAGYYREDNRHIGEYLALVRAGQFCDYVRRYVAGTESTGRFLQ